MTAEQTGKQATPQRLSRSKIKLTASCNAITVLTHTHTYTYIFSYLNGVQQKSLSSAANVTAFGCHNATNAFGRLLFLACHQSVSVSSILCHQSFILNIMPSHTHVHQVAWIHQKQTRFVNMSKEQNIV